MAIEAKTRGEKIRDILKRVAWASLALLFLVTGLGVGVWAFWVNTHPDKSTQQQTSKATLKGTKLSGFTPVAKVDTLQIADTQVGSGAAVVASSTVTVAYTGAVAATGTIFESTSDANGGQPVQFELSKVIKGWQEGMLGMKVGGQRRILIPAVDAYGASSPSADIPANAALVFDITLMAVK